MLTKFSNTVISSDDLALGRVGFGRAWNGEPFIDSAQFFRALVATLFARGDGPVEYTERVWRFFNSEAEVLTFCGAHRTELPIQADLLLIAQDGVAAIRMADAIRTVRFTQVTGGAVLTEYKFTGAQFISEIAPDPDEEDDDGNDLMKLNTVDLDAGDESRDIVFDTPFGGVPRNVAPIIEAPGSSICVGIAGLRNVTEAGFTVVFNAAIPDSGYKLRWSAQL